MPCAPMHCHPYLPAMLCTFTAAFMADSLKAAPQNGPVSRCLLLASTMCMGRLSLPLK